MKRTALLFLALALAVPVSCNALPADEKNEASDKADFDQATGSEWREVFSDPAKTTRIHTNSKP